LSLVSRMISRMILVRFLAILLGLSLFVLTLEAVAYGQEILALGDGSASIIAKYVVFRLPATLATFLPICFLLAFTELSYRNETTAIWAAGISPLRLAFMLLPLALLIGVLHFVLIDRVSPFVAPTLRSWGIADYAEKKLKLGEQDPIWMRHGKDILRAARANRDSTKLEDVIIFRRDETGTLAEQIYAKGAVLTAGGWQLRDVITYRRGVLTPIETTEMDYVGTMRAAAEGSRSGDPEEMTISDLNYFISNDGFGIRNVNFYQTWWHKRLTPFATAVLMVVFCVPLFSSFRRGGGLGSTFVTAVGVGFLYFIFDGIAASVSELGLLPPWFAVWLPVSAFAMLSAGMMLRTERV
jgi:lipopolysaccharide export system permease protein